MPLSLSHPGLSSSPKRFSSSLIRLLWLWLTLILTFYISWIALAKADFFYGTWYEVGNFAAHIDHYAPQNRFRHGFEQTDKTTRVELFGQIVHAIHQHGEGLKELYYVNATGRSIPLLHQSEIVHLKDVAKLIDFLQSLGWGLLLLWLSSTAFMVIHRINFPSIKSAFLQIGISLSAIGLLLALVGAQTVFYQLHIWIFPAEHRWFFYYQESLMSTLMKAPDLFAYIAASVTALSLILFSFIVIAFQLRASRPFKIPH